MEQIDIASIIAGLELQIQIRRPSSSTFTTSSSQSSQSNQVHSQVSQVRSILNTRVLSTDTQVQQIVAQQADMTQHTSMTQANLINFPIHRSFQRILRSILMRHGSHADNSGTVFTIMLHHPLVPLHISSVEMSCNQDPRV